MKTFIILLSLSVIVASSALAQKTIHGVVSDAMTGEGLPVAHLQVVGTRAGTITNENGEYVLGLLTVPATIRVSYIGYNSEQATVTESSLDTLDIKLTPSPIMLQAVVVSSEDQAVRIMREVIRRKQEWRKTLENYRAEAYTRVNLSNEKSIVSIAESISEINWDRKNGPRETIKAKRQTSNIKEEQNFASARMIPNFYDDDVDVVEYKTIGPTHPDALKHYEFKLIGQRQIDSTIVYDISMTPKSSLQPAFIGTLSVLDGEFAMIKVELKPNDVIRFPPPIKELNLEFEQQFSNFGQQYWLPVDVREEAEIKIKLPGLEFPMIKYSQVTRLTDYEVNVLPDSLAKKEKATREMTVSVGNGVSVEVSDKKEGSKERRPASKPDSLKASRTETASAGEGEKKDAKKISQAFSDSIFAAKKSDIIPFNTREQEAYSTIDSTMTMDKAFKPKGFLTRLIKEEDKTKEKKEQTGWKKPVSTVMKIVTPRFRYNRVEGYHLGLSHKKKIKLRFSYELYGAYMTGPEEWSYSGKATWRWGKNRNGTLTAAYANVIEPRYRTELYPLLFNSVQTLAGNPDYFDYLRNEKQRLEAGYRFSKIKTNVMAMVHNERHESAAKTSDESLLGSDYHQRENPAVEEGWLRSVELSAVYGSMDDVPLGVTGQNRIEMNVEHSAPDFLTSDFTFTQLRIKADWRFKTFLRRRFMPATLDVRFIGGISSGDLPVQRFGIVDGTMSVFSPFGSFRSLWNHPLEGEHYCAFFLEHNFRTVPFELVGLDWLVEKNIGLILHGAVGRTWISEKRLAEMQYKPFYQDSWRSEIGLSVNGVFGIFRIDVTRRLDRSGYYAGFGVTRYF